MFTSSATCASVTLPGSSASWRVTSDVTITTTWYVPTAAVFNGFGHKHATRRTPS
jgi:hypothetical protein